MKRRRCVLRVTSYELRIRLTERPEASTRNPQPETRNVTLTAADWRES